MRKRIMTVAMAAFFTCCISFESSYVFAEENVTTQTTQESISTTTEQKEITTTANVDTVEKNLTEQKKQVDVKKTSQTNIKRKKQLRKKLHKKQQQKRSKPKMKYAPGAIKGYQPEKTNQKEHLGKYLYYNQCDSIWNGNGLSIHSSGCGPTAMAVCIVNKTTKNVTPIDTASWAKSQGLYSSNGSMHEAIPTMANHWGLHCMGLGTDYNMIKKSLLHGNPVVALMGAGYFTGGGHFITLLEIDQNDKVLVADVASRKRSSQKYDLQFLIDQSKHADTGGPFWSIYKKSSKITSNKQTKKKKKLKQKDKKNTIRTIQNFKNQVTANRSSIEKNIPVEKLLIGRQVAINDIPSGTINEALYNLGEQLDSYELIYVSTHYTFGQQSLTNSDLKLQTIDVNEILHAFEKKG